MTSPITASQCLYIKLGQSGEFEKECLEKAHTLRLGYSEFNHQLCISGQWDKVHEICRKRAKSEGAATNHLNQLKYFYESDEKTLWYTFANGKLYWCFAKPEIELLTDGTKVRHCVGKWSSTDSNGKELLITQLSGKLTRTQAYRQTICPSKVSEYLLRRVNGQVIEQVDKAAKSLSQLESALEVLISDLGPKDFELLVELVFSNTGWIRVGAAGGHERDIDLELISPVTSERVAVQIKSKATQATLDDYASRFDAWNVNEFFFVFHTSVGKISVDGYEDGFVKLVDCKRLAKLVVSSGLSSWLIEKSA